MSLIAELKRRNVFRVVAAYVVLSWLLLQVGDILFDALELPEWTLKLVVGLLALGFIPTVFFSWAYELTPEGVKKEAEVDRTQSITPETGRKLDLITIAMILLGVGVVAVDRFMVPETVSEQAVPAEVASTPEPAEAEPARPDARSIAVLPFDNRSPDPDNAYFTDGVHDDLLTALSKIADLTVISRTSVLQYRDTTKPLPEIAGELGVAHILEGAVQRSGNQVRVNVQLIEAATDKHLWAEIFDRELTPENLFALQSEIATTIAEAMQATLSPQEQEIIAAVPTNSLEAHQLYQQARQHIIKRTVPELELARALLEQALEIDPDYAAVHAQLASIHLLMAAYGGIDLNQAMEAARRHVDRALLLDPTLGEAYAILGNLQSNDWDSEAAVRSYQRAIELTPGYPDTYHWYSIALQSAEPEEALALILKARALEPNSPIIAANTVWRYQAAGEVEKSRELAAEIAVRFPDYPYIRSIAGITQGFYGDRVGALAQYREAERLAPENNAQNVEICRAMMVMRALESARSCLDSYRDKLAEGPLNYWLGELAIERNDPQAAVEHLRIAVSHDPKNPFNRTFLADMLLTAGDAEGARDVLAEHSLPCDADVDPPDMTQAQTCVVTGRVMIKTGEVEQGIAVLERTLAYLQAEPRMKRGLFGNAVEDVRALSTLGRTEEALDALSEAVEMGWRHQYQWSRHSDLVSEIRGHPRFVELMRRIDEDMARQREQAESEGLL